MSENKETKQEVTNEELLRHLKEIEMAQGCVLNGINTLFTIISSKADELELDKMEREELDRGQVAIACVTECMMEISGMNEEVRKAKGHVCVVSKEEVGEFLDFLKDILK